MTIMMISAKVLRCVRMICLLRNRLKIWYLPARLWTGMHLFLNLVPIWRVYLREISFQTHKWYSPYLDTKYCWKCIWDYNKILKCLNMMFTEFLKWNTNSKNSFYILRTRLNHSAVIGEIIIGNRQNGTVIRVSSWRGNWFVLLFCGLRIFSCNCMSLYKWIPSIVPNCESCSVMWI